MSYHVTYRPEYPGQAQVQNIRGEWVPAIPLPFYGPIRKRCGTCGRKFWTLDGYRGHYAWAHTLGKP